MPLPPDPALGSLPSVALSSEQAPTNYQVLIKRQQKLSRKEASKRDCFKLKKFNVNQKSGQRHSAAN